MKIVGLYGGQDPNGLTAQYLKAVLAGASGAETEFVDLNQYIIRPDVPGEANPALDELEGKLAAADVWVLGSPTYFGTVAGQFKQFFDCFRHRMVRMTHDADTLPGKYKDKHYVSVSSCFASGLDNTFTHQTDATFTMIDKAMSAAGIHKVAELVLPGTWGMTTVPAKKVAQAKAVGAKLTAKKRKDDETLKRYMLLFGMIAVMALATMGIQQLLPWTTSSFWLRYVSFVIIFFVLLACILHYMTFVRHHRR
ncbi:flavodoxin family protein [Lacticaseibacillus camelliae]|uniref:Flavoprotein n=1 Tax=Lacticaseibacillus camelliae DSM 22697 = JCM 13995 TaxID=1423730 RepID=A0A0R2FLN3_9LACO|nr:flavodoxin family protein [Lacticaseibacillus camelliae]KRN25341.1 flavoprotein [Lacticaseibacillus camelliae DSM 22697 = JCM 13995]